MQGVIMCYGNAMILRLKFCVHEKIQTLDHCIRLENKIFRGSEKVAEVTLSFWLSDTLAHWVQVAWGQTFCLTATVAYHYEWFVRSSHSRRYNWPEWRSIIWLCQTDRLATFSFVCSCKCGISSSRRCIPKNPYTQLHAIAKVATVLYNIQRALHSSMPACGSKDEAHFCVMTDFVVVLVAH